MSRTSSDWLELTESTIEMELRSDSISYSLDLLSVLFRLSVPLNWSGFLEKVIIREERVGLLNLLAGLETDSLEDSPSPFLDKP